MHSETALVNKELIVWARKTAGLSRTNLAANLHLDENLLEQWEEGVSAPTISQLRLLAEKCRRSLACFYLPTPPPEIHIPRDYRRMYSFQDWISEPELHFEIREIVYRRQKALELNELLGREVPPFSYTARLDEDAEDLGAKIRELLGVASFKFISEYDAYAQWKMSIEKLGVLIFQISGFSIFEFRGLAISEFPLPVIALNSKDSPRPKIFSLLHEFTHLLIRQSSICNFNEDNGGDANARQVEVFCNMVAGAALLPKETILSAFKKTPPKNLEELEVLVRRISSFSHASQEVVWRRLLISKLISADLYVKKREELVEQYRASLKIPKKIPVPYSTRVLNRVGVPYASMVFKGYSAGKIATRDVSDFLGMKLKHFSKVREALVSKSMAYGKWL